MYGRILLKSGRMDPSKRRDAKPHLFEVNTETRVLSRNGLEIRRVTAQELTTLEVLVAQAPHIASPALIETKLWPAKAPPNSGQRIREIVSRWRDLLGDSAREPSFIETVPGSGYRLIARFETPVDDLIPTPEPVPEPPPPVPYPDPTQAPREHVSQLAGWTRRLWIAMLVALFALLSVSVLSSAYGLAIFAFCITAVFVALSCLHLRDSIYLRASVATFMILAMSYIASASTLPGVLSAVVNMPTLPPAIAYPFITGLKFIPLFVLLLAYWVLPSRKSLGLPGILFLFATAACVAAASGDYLIFKQRLPGCLTLVYGYALVLAINIVIWILGDYLFRTRQVVDFSRIFSLCALAYLPLAVTSWFIESNYNFINQHYLDKRRPSIYVVTNPAGLINVRKALRTTLRGQVGPLLTAMLEDPESSRELLNAKFYKQDFDEPFQLGPSAVIFGYKPAPRGPRDQPSFIAIRFPAEIVATLGFQPARE